jgi:hypothetical protein
MKMINVEVKGNRLYLTREELQLRLEARISLQQEYKAANNFNMWLISAGYIEAMSHLLSYFESND